MVVCYRLFGTTGYCAACNKVIPAFEMVMRAKNNVYHLECFACQQCNHRWVVIIVATVLLDFLLRYRLRELKNELKIKWQIWLITNYMYGVFIRSLIIHIKCTGPDRKTFTVSFLYVIQTFQRGWRKVLLVQLNKISAKSEIILIRKILLC